MTVGLATASLPRGCLRRRPLSLLRPAVEKATMSTNHDATEEKITKLAAVAGRWKFADCEAICEGPEQPQWPFGLSVSDALFLEGEARVTVQRTGSTGPIDGRIVLGYRSEKNDYLTVGIHSEGRAYQIVHYSPGTGWSPIASAGLAENLVVGHPITVRVLVRGQRVSLEADGVRVLETVSPILVPYGQLGLFTWLRQGGAMKFTDFHARAAKKDEWISAAEALAMLKSISTEYTARLRICERAHGGLIRARAEQYHYGEHILHDHDIPKEFWWAEGHQALEQDWTAGDFSTWIERGSIQLKVFGVTFSRADVEKLVPSASGMQSEPVAHTQEDEQVTDKLHALVPSAALSYQQAILDLKDDKRISFRGPALELREALREILDHLAPDSEVTSAPGYVQEKDRTGPTMKQKVRFIMKKKEKRHISDAPEQAAAAFEESIAALTRAVYKLSSKATHAAGERQSVVQLRRYVVAILHEIIEPSPGTSR